MLLLAGFQALLSRFTGEPDVSIGSPVAGRDRLEVEGLIGCFINLLVLRVDLADDPAGRALLDRVREVALDAYVHQELPFEKLVEELQPERSLEHTPLFRAMLVLQNAPRERVELPGLEISARAPGETDVKYDLTLNVTVDGDRLAATWTYAADLFERTTVERLGGGLLALLGAWVVDPDRRVSALPVLSAAESHQLLVEWNDTAMPVAGGPGETVVTLFARQVERAPEATAILCAGERLTYGELGRWSAAIAARLRAAGAGRGERVAIRAERSPATVAMVLGALASGAAYVMVDPTHPRGRTEEVIADCGAFVLMASEQPRGVPPAGVAGVALSAVAAPRGGARPESGGAPTPLDPAYVAYTSGSTGRPKGVLAHHLGLANHLSWVIAAHGFSPADVALQLAPATFDAWLRDTLAPLLAGGAVVVVAPDAARDPEALLDAILEHRVSCLPAIVPSLLRRLTEVAVAARARGRIVSSLRLILASGERLYASDAAAVRAAFGARVRLINQYGPTECTMISCYQPVALRAVSAAAAAEGDPTLPVGRPIANTYLRVLGRTLEALPRGAVGEVAIGGFGLAHGYLGQPDRTAEVFVPDPRGGAERPGARIYRTGDLGRLLADGTLEFLGRIDHQVKLRGQRVEPGELEAALRRHEGVQDAVVLARADAAGQLDALLVAYVVLRPARRPPSAAELHSFLQERIPEPLLPSGWVFLAELPLNRHGKVDRRALAEIAPAAASETGEAQERPWSPVEQLIAELWCEVLRLERVGLDDNFFELGGHSLLATQLASRLRRAFADRGCRCAPSSRRRPWPAWRRGSSARCAWARRGWRRRWRRRCGSRERTCRSPSPSSGSGFSTRSSRRARSTTSPSSCARAAPWTSRRWSGASARSCGATRSCAPPWSRSPASRARWCCRRRRSRSRAST